METFFYQLCKKLPPRQTDPLSSLRHMFRNIAETSGYGAMNKLLAEDITIKTDIDSPDALQVISGRKNVEVFLATTLPQYTPFDKLTALDFIPTGDRFIVFADNLLIYPQAKRKLCAFIFRFHEGRINEITLLSKLSYPAFL